MELRVRELGRAWRISSTRGWFGERYAVCHWDEDDQAVFEAESPVRS